MIVRLREDALVSRDETGEPLHRQGVLCNMTDRKGFEGALERLNHQHEMILNSAGEGIFGLDSNGKATFVNPAAARMTGWEAAELLGRPLYDVLHHTKPDGIHYPDEECPIRATLLDGTTRSRDEEVFWRKDGTSFPVEYTSTPIFEGNEIVGAVVTLRDSTDRKALEEKLQHQAFHDPLTGLPNRALFSDRLQHAVARVRRQGGKVAVLFVDLDNFKIVNDSLGHDAGDELLVGVAGRLRASLRTGDTAARLGGDEFALLLEDLEDVGEATRVAERIADKLRVPFALDDRETFVTASIGVALGATTERSEDLLRDADLAMYRAKQSGKARYALFEEAMSARALERLELSNDLHRALEQVEFAVHYQPKVSLATGRTVGFEALVRWEHPERGEVLPDRFVPLAEETSLIASIGQWVLREACRQTKGWLRRYPSDPPLIVCVNLSARQLRDPNLYGVVDQILEETRLEPSSLGLEITESVAMEDAPATAVALKGLHALGVRVIMDDFGTGYSSLSYLEKFPVDYVKIDRSFVGELEEESGARELVKGMIDLVHALGLEAIAEGVETAGQLERLRELGCDMAQGHYFSRPLPSGTASSLLESVLCGSP